MKNLLFLLVLVPFISFGQKKVDSVIFNGATKIITETGLTTSENLKVVTSALMENGFTVHSANNEIGTLRTDEKSIGTFGVIIIDVLAKDGSVALTSRARTTITEGLINNDKGTLKDFVGPIPYRKKKLIVSIFDEMTKISKALNAPFKYSN